MAEVRISSTELVRTIGEVLGRIRFRRDTFIVEKNGKPVAVLAPYAGKRPGGVEEALRAWCEAGAPDVDFADLLEKIGRDDKALEDPWDSR
jgi:hypothetical protein